MVVGTTVGLKLTVLNIYGPNEDCRHFFKKISLLVAEKGEGTLLIGEDFNCVLNHKLDKLPKKDLHRVKNWVIELMTISIITLYQ